MITVKTILVPFDFHEASERALEFARTLADAYGASLHLLHVIGYRLAQPQVLSGEQREACSRLEALLDDTDRQRRHITTVCRVGTIASEIVGYAADNAIDLIVMGTHQHGPSFEMATGSIADAVNALTPCDVLTVKGANDASRAVRGLPS